MSGLTYQQQLALAITPKITSSLSIPCSMFVIYEAWCDYRQGRSNAIQRSLVGMSCIDVMASSAWWLSTWAVPRGSFALSAGNKQSCNYQGFLLQLAIGAPLYNCSLALYYLMVIKYNWSNEMLRRIELWTHSAILSFSIGTSFALLPLGVYNHIGAVCWVIGSPARCGNSSYQGSDVPCERGDHAYLYGLALFYGPLWVCIIACITSMAVIYFEVRKTHRRLKRYSLQPGRQVHRLRRSATDTSSVATQALLYSVSFFITWLPSTVWSIAHWFNVEAFWLDYASAFCEPLQGFWNCLIFLRRRPSSQEKIRQLANILIPFCCREAGDTLGSDQVDFIRRSSALPSTSSHVSSKRPKRNRNSNGGHNRRVSYASSEFSSNAGDLACATLALECADHQQTAESPADYGVIVEKAPVTQEMCFESDSGSDDFVVGKQGKHDLNSNLHPKHNEMESEPKLSVLKEMNSSGDISETVDNNIGDSCDSREKQKLHPTSGDASAEEEQSIIIVDPETTDDNNQGNVSCKTSDTNTTTTTHYDTSSSHIDQDEEDIAKPSSTQLSERKDNLEIEQTGDTQGKAKCSGVETSDENYEHDAKSVKADVSVSIPRRPSMTRKVGAISSRAEVECYRENECPVVLKEAPVSTEIGCVGAGG